MTNNGNCDMKHYDVTFFNKYILTRISRREKLTSREIYTALSNILNGYCSDIFISAFMMYLIFMGETLDEIKPAFSSVKDNSLKITPMTSSPLVDNCGTGGDLLNTFNISTAAAIVAGSCKKVSVAKHGNRSSSSLSGSADFFELIGYDIWGDVKSSIRSIEKYNLGFLFAPLFHPGLKHVSNVRKELGIRTIFNKIGPLCNPCTNLYGQVIGVSDPLLLDLIPKLMPDLGLRHALVVHSFDGMDELSTTGKNTIMDIYNHNQKLCIKKNIIDPVKLGFPKSNLSDITVKDKLQSVKETLRIIYGINSSKSKEDIVLLNSAAVLIAGDVVGSFIDAVDICTQYLKNGSAQKMLEDIIRNFGDISKLENVEKML